MAAKLVDMKYTKAEAKAEATKYDSIAGQPEYPWGLQIRLEDEELTKLGIKTLPDVGASFTLTVVTEVQSATETKMASGKTDRCVCLQITQLGVDAAGADDDEQTPAPAAAKQPKQPTKGGVMGRS